LIADNAAGSAFQTAFPGKDYFIIIIKGIILHRTNIGAKLVRAGTAYLLVNADVGVSIDVE
jgi:hypothetical protein